MFEIPFTWLSSLSHNNNVDTTTKQHVVAVDRTACWGFVASSSPSSAHLTLRLLHINTRERTRRVETEAGYAHLLVTRCAVKYIYMLVSVCVCVCVRARVGYTYVYMYVCMYIYVCVCAC